MSGKTKFVQINRKYSIVLDFGSDSCQSSPGLFPEKYKILFSDRLLQKLCIMYVSFSFSVRLNSDGNIFPPYLRIHYDVVNDAAGVS